MSGPAPSAGPAPVRRPAEPRWPRPAGSPPPFLLGAAGPGVWRCRSRALPGSAATATAAAGSSSPSTGEGRGRRGARGPGCRQAWLGRAAAATAGALGLARRAGTPGPLPGLRGGPSPCSRALRRGAGDPGTGGVTGGPAPPWPAWARGETVGEAEQPAEGAQPPRRSVGAVACRGGRGGRSLPQAAPRSP